MNWLKPNEVTEPGNYLYGSIQMPKYGFDPLKVKISRRQLSYNDGLILEGVGGFELHQKEWPEEFRFFGPIPPMD